MGSLHAQEYTGAELATRFGEQLVENYGLDPDTTWLLDYFKVAIVPIANPDGRKFAEQGYSWRKNTNQGNGSAEEPTYGNTVQLVMNDEFGGVGSLTPGWLFLLLLRTVSTIFLN